MRGISGSILLITLAMGGCQSNIEGPVIAINFGSTNCSVGVWKNNMVQIILNEKKNSMTPSVVAFTESETLIGEASKNQAIENPTATIYKMKKVLGRKFHSKEVQHQAKIVPYEIVNSEGRVYIKASIKGESKVFSPEQISAKVIMKMKQRAEKHLNEEVKNAVMTVPAYFNDLQRRALKDAGTLSGLNVLRIVNEPIATALAYNLNKNQSEKTFLVYDLGGGSFDVSIISVQDGDFELLYAGVDPGLGGKYFDQRLMDYYSKIIENNLDISKDKRALQKLKREVERAKKALSIFPWTIVKVQNLFDGQDFSDILTRDKFEELNEDLFKRTLSLIQKALKTINLKKHEIDGIIFSGGSTKIPKIQKMVKHFFKGKQVYQSIDLQEIVAFGAAIRGETIRTDKSMSDCGPLLELYSEQGKNTKFTHKVQTNSIEKSKIVLQDRKNQQEILSQEQRSINYDLTFPKHNFTASDSTPQIKKTFEADIYGILQVSRVNGQTGTTQTIGIPQDNAPIILNKIHTVLQKETQLSHHQTKAKTELEIYEKALQDFLKLSNNLKNKLMQALQTKSPRTNQQLPSKVFVFIKKLRTTNNKPITKVLIQLFRSLTEFIKHKVLSKICLLYTSPSPRDLSTSRMPSSA